MDFSGKRLPIFNILSYASTLKRKDSCISCWFYKPHVFVVLKFPIIRKIYKWDSFPPTTLFFSRNPVSSYMALLSNFLFCRVYKALSHTSSHWNLTTTVFNYKCEIGEIVFQWALITFSQKGATHPWLTTFYSHFCKPRPGFICTIEPFMLHSYSKGQTGRQRAESIQIC